MHSKTSNKTLPQQIDVVAEFFAHKISPQRIAYRTGIALELVEELINGETHKALFTRLISKHMRQRRDQRLYKSKRLKGVAQAELQDKIKAEFKGDTIKAAPSRTHQ